MGCGGGGGAVASWTHQMTTSAGRSNIKHRELAGRDWSSEPRWTDEMDFWPGICHR